MNWPFKRVRREDDLDEEIAAHLSMARADGVDIRQFGNVTLVKEVTREIWGWGSLDRLWQDTRLGWRGFVRTPAFTVTAVLTLGLGIGASTTMYSVIASLLLDPLPALKTGDLAAIYSLEERGQKFLPVSRLEWEEIAARNRTFAGIAAFSGPTALGLTTADGEKPRRFFVELATANYFDVLGLTPIRGRYFARDEDRAGGAATLLVLSHAAWRKWFGGAEDTIGRRLWLNGVPFTVIGIAPEGFRGITSVFGPDAWIPSTMAPAVQPMQMNDWLTRRGAQVFRLMGRRKPGVSMAQADANLRVIGASFAKQHPEESRGKTLTARSAVESAFGPGQRQPAILGGAVLLAIAGLVLLIACSNVANLLLARAAARRAEMAVRTALGAGRLRLLRQMLTESALLGLMASACGVAVAYASVRAMATLRPADVAANLVAPRFEPSALLFALAVSLFTGVVFGMAPAFEGLRGLRETRGMGRGGTLRGLLLAAQVAFSLMALVTAGLFLRGMEKAYALDPGFETTRLGMILLDPAQAGWGQAQVEQYYRDAALRTSATPGVTDAALASNLPLFGRTAGWVVAEGAEQVREAARIRPIMHVLQPGYFKTLGIPLVDGRDFTDADRLGAAPVAVINETLARQLWPGGRVLGRRIRLADETFYRDVVGVSSTVNYQSLGEGPQPAVHLPFAQKYSPAMVLYFRTAGEPWAVAGAVQKGLRGMDARVSVEDVRTAAKVIDDALFGPRIAVGLLSVFGLLGLGLASVGLYGVTAFGVSQRQREIGVRMVLGAGPGTVVRLVVLDVMRWMGLGALAGLAAAMAVAKLIEGMLFGVGAWDPASIVGACVFLGLTGVVACYLPARRATRVDPNVVLRQT